MTRPATARRPPIREVADDKLRPFRDDVLREIMRLRKGLDDLEAQVSGGGGDGAPSDSQYVLIAADADLPNARVLANGTNTTVNTGVAGQVSIDAPAAGAPTNASYVVIGLNGTLTAERVLTAGTGITVTDGGANGNATIATTITQYTDEMAQDAVGNILAASDSIFFNYSDLANEITAEIQPDGVTFSMMQEIATDRLIGRDTAGSGNPEEIAVTNGLAFTGSQQIGIANDGVTFARMQNIATDRLIGRDTAGSGDPEEISLGNGLAWSGSGSIVVDIDVGDVYSTLYEVDYTTLANNTLVDGAETIDGLSYVAANMAELGTAAVQNGTGIRMVAATSNGGAVTMTSASQLIPYIYVPLSQITGYNPVHEYVIEIYMSARILEANGEYVALGLWGVAGSPFASSTARMRAAKLVRNAGDTADVMRITTNATDSTGDVAIDSHDVMAIRVNGYGFGQAYSGIWSGGWPTSYTAHSAFPTVVVADSPCNTTDMRIFMGLGCANDASPTTSVTIARMRIRRAL